MRKKVLGKTFARKLVLFFVSGALLLEMPLVAWAAETDSSGVYLEEDVNEQENFRIEEIIMGSEGIKSTNTLKKEELDKFLNSGNENALIGKTEKEIEAYFSAVESGILKNKTGSVITNPITYLHKNVAKSTDKYTVISTKTVSGTASKTCSDLGGHNNCTLVALYNIMVHYRGKGYSKIPSKQSELYSIIKKQATKLGYNYEKSKGLSVTKNDNLVTNTWRKGFGYSAGKGTNNYLWTYSTATNSIKKGKPIMFSLASGVYFDHTVTVYGYKVYKNNRTGKKYTFLMLKDGWSNSTRYLAWRNTGASYVGCVTSIKAP